MNTAAGYTLGAFGAYLLCEGQVPLDALGYSSLPINLVEAGFQQLQKIPGNQVPTKTATEIQGCHNPTFSTNGTNTLADTDPYPPACDKAGPTQCSTGTGGASKSPTPVNPKASPTTGPSTGTSSGTSPGTGAGASPGTGTNTGTGADTGTGASSADQGCSPDSGNCATAAPASGDQTGGQGGTTTINAIPVDSPVSLGDGLQVDLMVLAAVLLVGLILAPPLIAQASRRRRQRDRSGWPGGPGAFL